MYASDGWFSDAKYKSFKILKIIDGVCHSKSNEFKEYNVFIKVDLITDAGKIVVGYFNYNCFYAKRMFIVTNLSSRSMDDEIKIAAQIPFKGWSCWKENM